MHSLLHLSLFATWLSYSLCTTPSAPAGSWDQFNYAPSSRTVFPASIFKVVGTVNSTSGPFHQDEQITLSGNDSYVTFDFGKEVGGIVSFNINEAMPNSSLAITFTESSMFISPDTCDTSTAASPSMNNDGVELLQSPLTIGQFTQPPGLLRGGFRFLSIISKSESPVTISNISVSITFSPSMEVLTDYTGYFSAQDPLSKDENFLTKVWYAGGYTVQSNVILVNEGRQPLSHGWANNATGGPVNGTILVDGAKRDRNVWPGDMGISLHTQFVSTNDLVPSRNSLAVMFSTQNPTSGALQYSGPPINAQGSDTYICWTLIGTHSYHLYTGDLDFVKTVWSNYTKAMAFMTSQIDDTGLLNVPLSMANDWGRANGQGHNSAANAIMYQTLLTGADLASQMGENETAAGWIANATILKAAYNSLLWDASAGLYKDNDTATTLHPQDGNSLAVLFNLTDSSEKATAVSEGLTENWTDIGPISPELNDTIIPFVGGFELQAHFVSGNGERALDLLRREWGYMLTTNLSVQSTLLEGFSANGSLGYRSNAGYMHDFSYTSHAHGWSTGPTSALTFFVLGLKLETAMGQTWSVAPVLSGLKAAEGGFGTGLGWFGVQWSEEGGVLKLSIETPKGTSGVVTMPGTGTVTVDGKKIGSSSQVALNGGNHTLSRST